MKTHTRQCSVHQQPCPLEHTYFCKYCGEEFITDESTHYRTPAGVILPIETWPYCTNACEWSDNSGESVRIENELPTHNNGATDSQPEGI